MKKKVIATLVAAVACVTMVFSAFAADSTQGTLVSDSDKVTVTPVDTATVEAAVKDVVDKAEAGQDVTTAFAGQTQISGIELAGMKFLSEMLSYTNAAPGEKVTFTANNLTSGMVPYFLVYANGKWEMIKADVNGKQLSAVLPEGGIVCVVYKTADGAVVDGSGNPVNPADKGSTTSPKTGEAVTLPLAVLAAALVSVGLVAAKKSKASEC